MSTAADSIERTAEATGLLPATVFRGARSLRESNTTLWPQGSQGRGRAAHVEPSHLVNLTLAITCADPITTAPVVVPRYRGLKLADAPGVRLSPQVGGGITSFLVSCLGHPAGLGADLEALLDALAQADDATRAGVIASALAVELDLNAKAPAAAVCWTAPASDGRAGAKREGGMVQVRYAASPYYLGPSAPDGSSLPARPRHKVELPAELLLVLADLWANTLATRGQSKSSSTPGTPKPGNENAALPGAASPKTSLHPKPAEQRNTTAQIGSLNTSDHAMRVCVSSSGAEAGSGPLHLNPRRTAHARIPHHHAPA